MLYILTSKWLLEEYSLKEVYFIVSIINEVLFFLYITSNIPFLFPSRNIQISVKYHEGDIQII